MSIIKRSTADLEKNPKVVGIGFGPEGMKGRSLNVPTIKVYLKGVSEKEAIKLKLPSAIADYKVDAVLIRSGAAGCSNCPNTDDAWYGQIRPGNNIGDRTQCGTLGMKLWERGWHGDRTQGLETQPEYFLTAYHVLPWLGTDVYQPGAPRVVRSDNIVGQVDKTISWIDSGGEFEVSLVRSNKSRILLQDPHAPVYPYDPALGVCVHLMGAGDMTFGDVKTHYGWGVYIDYLLWVDVTFNLPPPIRMYDQMLVLPEDASDVLGADTCSGGVFYDDHGIPVGTQVAMVDFHPDTAPQDVNFRGAIASFLNRQGGPDILSQLGVSNVPPTPLERPPTW